MIKRAFKAKYCESMKLEAELEIPIFLLVVFCGRYFEKDLEVWSVFIVRIIISRKYPTKNMGSAMFMVELNVSK